MQDRTGEKQYSTIDYNLRQSKKIWQFLQAGIQVWLACTAECLSTKNLIFLISSNILPTPNFNDNNLLHKQYQTHDKSAMMHTRSLLIIAQVLNLIVVVIKQPAEVQLVVVFALELNGMRLLSAFLPKHHLVLSGVVVHRHYISHVVTEGIDSVVFGGVNGRPRTCIEQKLPPFELTKQAPWPRLEQLKVQLLAATVFLQQTPTASQLLLFSLILKATLQGLLPFSCSEGSSNPKWQLYPYVDLMRLSETTEMPLCLSSGLNLKSTLESNTLGFQAVFCRIKLKAQISALILVYLDFKSFQTFFCIAETACSISEPLIQFSSSSGSSGTPASSFCIKLTKASYYISLVLMSSRALTSWSVAPAFTSICSSTFIKMASMLLLILSKESLTYFSKSPKVVSSLVLVSRTELLSFSTSRERGVSPCRYFSELLMMSLRGRILWLRWPSSQQIPQITLLWMHCGSRQTRFRTSPTWHSPLVHSGYLNCSPDINWDYYMICDAARVHSLQYQRDCVFWQKGIWITVYGGLKSFEYSSWKIVSCAANRKFSTQDRPASALSKSLLNPSLGQNALPFSPSFSAFPTRVIQVISMEKSKMQKIKQQAAKLGTSYYKFVQPFIININEKIGRGSYGEVFKGADIRTGNLVAVKTISTANIKKDPQKFYESLKNEIQIMKAIKNPNIVELFDVKKSSNNIYLFQELCDKGSLEDVLEKRKKMPEAEALIVIKQLISGYRYLHQHSVIHRDLKPANILIKDETYKLADFGFAKFFQEGAELEQIHQSLVGSPMYMCPEILNGSTYSTKSDVWSMGVIFYQLLFGKTPHKATSLEQLISKVNKKVIRFPQKLTTPGLQELLESMLKYAPEERISWKDIFSLQMFKQKQKEGNDINRSMSLAQKGSKDKLDMSTKMNAIYFEDKKVIQQIELTNNDEKEISVVQSRDANESKEQDIYKSIAQKYEETEGKKDVIRKIKNWFLFKRNKAVFLNHLSLKIHNCFAMDKLNIPLHKAEIFILVLSKWQCMITYKSYIRLKEGKINSKAFTEDQYKLFINNNIRDKIMDKFKNDFTVMKMFFDELVKKVEVYLAKFEGELPQNLKRIKKICNQSLCPKELFAQIYNETVDQLSDVCKDAIKNDPKCREVIQLAYLVSEAMKLKKDQLETQEFSMIYDQEEKLTNEELMYRIEGKAQDD